MTDIWLATYQTVFEVHYKANLAAGTPAAAERLLPGIVMTAIGIADRASGIQETGEIAKKERAAKAAFEAEDAAKRKATKVKAKAPAKKKLPAARSKSR